MTTRKKKTNSHNRLRKRPMCLYVEPEQYERLKRASADSLVPMMAILREGLDAILAAKYGEGGK